MADKTALEIFTAAHTPNKSRHPNSAVDGLFQEHKTKRITATNLAMTTGGRPPIAGQSSSPSVLTPYLEASFGNLSMNIINDGKVVPFQPVIDPDWNSSFFVDAERKYSIGMPSALSGPVAPVAPARAGQAG